MKIIKLVLKDFKQIDELSINFGDEYLNDKESSFTYLLGNNGSGKTTIFEAIMLIFASFYSPVLRTKYAFSYQLLYRINGKLVELKRENFSPERSTDNKKSDSYSISINENKEEFSDFNIFRRRVMVQYELLPQKIVVLYSGINDRFKLIYKNIHTSYSRNLSMMRNYIANGNDTKKVQKNFVYSDGGNIHSYLLAAWLDSEKARNIIKDYCNLEEISCLKISINLAYYNLTKILPNCSSEQYKKDFQRIRGWSSSKRKYLKEIYRDESYIYENIIDADIIEGTFVEEAVSIIQKQLPIEIKKIVDIKTVFRYDRFFGLGISLDIDLSKSLIKGTQLFEFLASLETQFYSSIEVIVLKDGTKFSATELSEGECQLIKILGMIILTKNSEGIVLLDEPEVHLNPNWKYKFNEIINGLLEETHNTQVLINTHDPLVINGTKSTDIRIITKEKKKIYSKQPISDAVGRSIDGLLQGQFFGLETTLDYVTKSKMKKRESLFKEYQKLLKINNKDNNSLNCVEEKLDKLDKEIKALPFTSYSRQDKLYEEYSRVIREMALDVNLKDLGEKELEDRKKIIRKIIREVMKK